jgi:hypothetical protein
MPVVRCRLSVVCVCVCVRVCVRVCVCVCVCGVLGKYTQALRYRDVEAVTKVDKACGFVRSIGVDRARQMVAVVRANTNRPALDAYKRLI